MGPFAPCETEAAAAAGPGQVRWLIHTNHTVFYCVVGVAVKLVESENFTEANDCI